jgi:hypothetical protein
MQIPEPAPIKPAPPWYQFRISYLFYLLTLFAIAATLLRPFLDFHSGWKFTIVAAIYVAALTLYFGIRIPILLRRFQRKRLALDTRRQELQKLATEIRHAHQEPGSDP